jgi:phage gp16-like protein
MPNRQISKKQIALLHVAKAQLGLSDEVYREMLGSVGVLSSLQLTAKQYNEIMARLEAGGFRAASSGASARRNEIAGRQLSSPERKRMLGKIDKLSEAMRLPPTYALGVAKRMWGVEKLTWCTPQQLRGVLAALVKKQQADARKEVAA